MKRWERVWIIEYKANNGHWYPVGSEFYDYKFSAKVETAERKANEKERSTYRITPYIRRVSK